MALATVGEVSYHITNSLRNHWMRNNLEVIKKTNSDRVYIVDGMERIGKTTWTFQQTGIIDPKMWETPETFVSRVCFSSEEFYKAITTVENGCIVFDEAFRGLSSRMALSKTNKKLVQALMEMGQHNNIVFIVLPRIFLLDIYVAMLRSHGLFNIYQNKLVKKRAWRGFNIKDKNFIYQFGIKRGWQYPAKTNFRGNFYSKFPGGKEYEKAYLTKKSKAFKDIKGDEGEEFNRYKVQRDAIFKALYESHYTSLRKLSKFLKEEANLEITYAQLSYLLKTDTNTTENALKPLNVRR